MLNIDHNYKMGNKVIDFYENHHRVEHHRAHNALSCGPKMWSRGTNHRPGNMEMMTGPQSIRTR
jgi:hypothetical protein